MLGQKNTMTQRTTAGTQRIKLAATHVEYWRCESGALGLHYEAEHHSVYWNVPNTQPMTTMATTPTMMPIGGLLPSSSPVAPTPGAVVTLPPISIAKGAFCAREREREPRERMRMGCAERVGRGCEEGKTRESERAPPEKTELRRCTRAKVQF